ncbi:MAG: TOMM system kinase/cyclase fusion protein [Polyangiaceae bacterium]
MNSRSDDSTAPQLQSIAGYTVLETLGVGGFARVYRAVHQQTHRSVALKLLHFNAAVEEEARAHHRERFWRETALCANLHHPNIVGLVDRGQTATGELFAAYDYVPGDSLRAVLERRGALPADEASDLMGQVLDALACAHGSGIIHRDLKPENIMVTQTGTRPHAVVLDFGIGAFLEHARHDGPKLTQTFETMGTPAYTAPEQLRKEAPTPKSDIYAWGLVFLECLLGEPVIGGDNIAQMFQRQLDPTEIAIPVGIADTPLGAMLRSVLRKNPAVRRGDPAALHEELRRLNVAGLVGVLEAPPRAPTRPPRDVEDAAGPNSDVLVRTQRRQVTILCGGIDLRAPLLSDRLEEVLERLVRDLLDEAHEIVERHGGWVAGSLGGRMLVYFGFPRASDSAASRSVRAALHVTSRIRTRLADHADIADHIRARWAVHTGPVTEADDGLAEGITQNRAMWLSAHGPAGDVCVSATTARLLADRGEFELIPREAEGAESESIFAVIARSPAEVVTPVSQHPFVGRATELRNLQEAWQRTRDGVAQTVLLVGEPGVGKSSVVQEFLRRANVASPPTRICRCVPEQRNSALSPLLALVRQSWERPSPASTEDAANTIHTSMAHLGPEAIVALPILYAWLGVTPSNATESPKESAAKQKDVLLDLLDRWLFSSSGDGAVPLVIEDLHWADATTLEFVSRRIASRGNRRGFLVLTARPEFDSPWKGEGVVTHTLSGLDSTSVNDLVRATHSRPLAPTTLSAVTERTAGVPLFVLEVVRMLAEESHLEVRDGSYHLKRAMTALPVPFTLRDALAERLDRLGEARQTAALAAALGREFSKRLLGAITTRTQSDLDADLVRLTDAQIITRLSDTTDDSRYVFRHALIRELAYGAMLPSHRELVHGRIADELSHTFPELAKSDPGRLAPHLAAAGRFGPAVEHGTRAAQTALERSASAEAAAHAEAVLAWMEFLPEPERLEPQLGANTILTQALMATRGWADPEVKARIDFSMKLVDEAHGQRWHLPARWALMTYHYVAGNRGELEALAYETERIADELADDGLRPAALTFVGLVDHGAGRYAKAESAFSECQRLYSRAAHRDHGSRYGLDSLAWSLATLALVRWFRGDASDAYAASREAIAWARELDHVPTLGIVLLYAANLHHYARNREAVAQTCAELIALDAQYGYPAYAAYGMILKAWAVGDAETPSFVIGQLEAMGCRAAISYYGSLAAETDAEAGRCEAALAKLDRAIEAGIRIDEHYYEPELLLQRGTLLRRMGNAAAATVELDRALALSRAQGMTWTESRVAQAIRGA